MSDEQPERGDRPDVSESDEDRPDVSGSDGEDLAQGYVPDALLPDDLRPELNPLAASPEEDVSQEGDTSSQDTDEVGGKATAQPASPAPGEATNAS